MELIPIMKDNFSMLKFSNLLEYIIFNKFSVKYIFFQNAILSYKWVLYKYGFLELYWL